MAKTIQTQCCAQCPAYCDLGAYVTGSIVYDYEDTLGRPIPEYLQNPFQVEGHLDQEKWDNTLNHCIEQDEFRILYTAKSFLKAACVSRRAGDEFIIEINRDFEDKERKYSSLVHEIAHVYCGHLGDDYRKKKRWEGRKHLMRNQEEIEAESVAYLVCNRTGLETRSIEYVAGYLKNPEEDIKQISIKKILDVTQKVEDMAAYDCRENNIIPYEIKKVDMTQDSSRRMIIHTGTLNWGAP